MRRVVLATCLLFSVSAATRAGAQPAAPPEPLPEGTDPLELGPPPPPPPEMTEASSPPAPDPSRAQPGYASGYPAYEQPSPPPPPPPRRRSRPRRDVSLTFSPIHLLSPVVEVMGEVRAADWLGVSVIGGYGSVTVGTSSSTDTLRAYELGGQLSFYPTTPFEKLLFGVEVLWLKLDTSDYAGSQIEASAAGVAIGPMVGYKVVARGGFTFLAQGGMEYVTARAKATDGNTTASGKDSALIPLLNLNVGWSF